MCKADAYGHGAMRVAEAVPAAFYGVATEEEGLPLRGLGKEVLVTAPSVSSIELCAYSGMIPMIGAWEVAYRAAACGVRRCHIKVNSGMNRLGFTGEKECYTAAEYLSRAGVEVVGIDTHYKSSSDQNVIKQNQAFHSAVLAVNKALAECGVSNVPITSVTGCGARFASSFDYLRFGLTAYGYPSCEALSIRLEPAMTVTSEVIKVKTIERGQTLGYNGSYVAKCHVKAYTVLGGYGDGVTRAEQGRYVLAAGRRLGIAAVSMDSFEMTSQRVDLSVGARVIILSKAVNAAYIAKQRGTIPYEVLLGYNVPRANRVYV